MKFINILKEHSVNYKNKVAIVDGNIDNNNTTYFEIEKISNKIANKLIKLGVKSNDRIIVNLDRGALFFIAEVAVLKVNATFIPVMSSYPKDRVEYIRNDSNAKYIIDNDFFNDIEMYEDVYEGVYEENIDEEGLATILYTSGSTGNPKGVCWPKKIFDEVIERSDKIFDGIEDIKYGTVAPMTFVVIFTDLYGTLRKAGTVYLIPNDIKNDAKKISEYYVKNKLTCGFLPPRLNKIFEIESDYLKQINVVGERVSKQFSSKYNTLNLYGQTEGWMYTTFMIDKMYDNTPVGKPLNGIEIKILDENNIEVSRGVEGEICPVGLFPYEYNNLPELTDKIYKKLEDGRVLIHTGDIGKIDENGNLLYINRNDFMIKLHGLRVEPGEIENIVCSIPFVTNAVAKAFEMEDGTMVFCVFYTANEHIKSEIIREKIVKKVPSYMVPSIIYQMDSFPVNQNGKIDRKNIKLPNKNLLKADYEEPRNDIECKLCDGFKKIFNIDKIGINDNFFELGGNSLNSVKLASICGIENLSSNFIMQGMTPKRIAKILIDNAYIKKPDIERKKIEKEEYKIPNSISYQYENCKITNQPMEEISANLYYKIPDNIDIEKLKKAIYDTINENKVYKIAVDIDNDKIFFNKKEFVINEISIKSDDFKKYRQDRCKKHVDYKNDFLVEIDIINVDNEENYFHFIINHLIYDMLSIKNFLINISKKYVNEKYIEERDIFDVAEYEANIENTIFYKEAEKYYDSVYDSIKEFSLLKKEKKYVSAFAYPILNHIEEEKILKFLKTNHATYLSYFLLCLELTISKFFNQNDFTYMNIYNGRMDNKLMNTHGGLARGIFLRSSFYKSNSISEKLENINDYYQKILYYDVVSFKNIIDKYKNIRSGITFNYKDTIDFTLKLGDSIIFPSFLEELSNVGIYVDMDIMINNFNNQKLLVITSTRFSNEELDKFAKIFDEYCQYLLDEGK